MKILGPSQIASLLGADEKELKDCCGSRLNDLSYEELDREERDRLILQIIQKIDSTDLPSAGTGRLQDWNAGWGENKEDFIRSNFDVASLVPKYFRRKAPLRLFSELVMPHTEHFLLRLLDIQRVHLFAKYFSDKESIYEFGCGTGHHLGFMAQMFPNKKYFGLDWSDSSAEILAIMRKELRIDISGGKFDFFNPDRSLNLNPDSGVLTFGALEQTGDDFEKFLDFLIEKRPAICVHVECIDEYYDRNNLLEYLALRYHQRRNYLKNFLGRLRAREGNGQLRLLHDHHVKLGNIYNDTHSVVVWKVV